MWCAIFSLKQCFMKSTCLNGQQPIIICVYGLHPLLSVFWKCIEQLLSHSMMLDPQTGTSIHYFSVVQMSRKCNGQVLGDFIIKINATKITPDMYIGKVWQLKTHYGVLIWLLVFLLSFIIGMLVEKKKRG